jgi:hypothetical protein
VNEAPALPAVDALVQRWQQFLDDGAGTPAEPTAVGGPVSPAQLLIDQLLADPAHSLTAPADPDLPEPPPVIPDYTVLGPLGEGGMGIVYRVRDALDREWALKLARKGQLTAHGRERFLDEAKAMSRLTHPSLVPVHAYQLTPGGRPYFLMPIYPDNLGNRLADYQSDVRKAIELMAAVAEGVGHLHAHGYIHRDLKPQNILLTADGRPAVSDFGLVKDLSADGPEIPPDPASSPGTGETRPSGARRSRTRAGLAMGTRAYMAPEQAAGQAAEAGPHWDVWAIGVLLHELLTGRRPPSSDAPHKLLNPAAAKNPPPSHFRRDLDPRLDRIVSKCLARSEADRYADANQVATDLRRCLPAPRSRRRAMLVAAGLAALVLGLVLIATLWPGRAGIIESPTDPLADSRKKLQAGETVVLIPETGMPAWWRPVHGDHVKPYLDEVTKTFTIDANRWAFVELFTDPGIDRYRFEFEVRQLRTADVMRQGGYVGRHLVPSPYRAAHAFLSLGTTECLSQFNGEPRPGLVICRHHFLIVNEDGLDVNHKSQFQDVRFPGVADLAQRPWRRVEVDVSPVEFVWFLNGQEVGRTAARLEGLERSTIVSGTSLPPDTQLWFTPRGGLGVYVESSIASFRNARIVPRRDD